MERAALLPHPRWRRFRDTVTQPRWLVGIAAVAVLLAVGGIFGSQLLLETEDEERREARASTPADTTVAVLNGTTVAGLGGKVGDDVEANEFTLGDVTHVPRVGRADGRPVRAGLRRAPPGGCRRSLGGVPVQPIDREAQRLAEGADVVVIAGQDRGHGVPSTAPSDRAGAADAGHASSSRSCSRRLSRRPSWSWARARPSWCSRSQRLPERITPNGDDYRDKAEIRFFVARVRPARARSTSSARTWSR